MASFSYIRAILLFAAGADIVFVARAHLATRDDIFQDETGPAGQFGSGLPKFAPGSKLMLRQADGSLQTLVNGASPSAATSTSVRLVPKNIRDHSNRDDSQSEHLRERALEFAVHQQFAPPGSITTAEVWIDANQFTGAYCYD